GRVVWRRLDAGRAPGRLDGPTPRGGRLRQRLGHRRYRRRQPHHGVHTQPVGPRRAAGLGPRHDGGDHAHRRTVAGRPAPARAAAESARGGTALTEGQHRAATRWRERAPVAAIRLARRVLANTPAQRLPPVAWAYRRIVRAVWGDQDFTTEFRGLRLS